MNRNPRLKTTLYILLGLTLMFIWGNSMLPAESSGKLSHWVGLILAKLLPFASEHVPTDSEGVLRKLAHGTEFLVLGMELYLLLVHFHRQSWSLPPLCGLLAAAMDETIQIFSPGRSSALKDVWIDFGGVAAGCILAAALLYRRRKHRADA